VGFGDTLVSGYALFFNSFFVFRIGSKGKIFR
jgi:hypothetical protein